jgi:hypothetical protein
VVFGWGNRRSEPEPAKASSVIAALQPGGSGPDSMADMAGEKRDLERVPLEGQVRGEVMVFQPMTILDISIGGAQIETAFALQLDSLHDFRLTLGDRSIIVKGRIAHCHIGELTDVAALYRTGIEFVQVSEHAGNAIRDFVKATKYSRSHTTIIDGIIADDDRNSNF